MTFQYGQWEINNAECVQKMDAKLEAMHLVQLAMSVLCFCQAAFMASRLPRQSWEAVYLPGAECILYAMASSGNGYLKIANGKMLPWARMASWLATCPVMLNQVNTISPLTIYGINLNNCQIALAVVRVVNGISASSVNDNSLKWGFFFMGVFCLVLEFAIAFQIFDKGLKKFHIKAKDSEICSRVCDRLQILRGIFFAAWTMFPLVWLFSPQGTCLLGEDVVPLLYLVADLICKNCYGVIWYHTTWHLLGGKGWNPDLQLTDQEELEDANIKEAFRHASQSGDQDPASEPLQDGGSVFSAVPPLRLNEVPSYHQQSLMSMRTIPASNSAINSPAQYPLRSSPRSRSAMSPPPSQRPSRMTSLEPQLEDFGPVDSLSGSISINGREYVLANPELHAHVTPRPASFRSPRTAREASTGKTPRSRRQSDLAEFHEGREVILVDRPEHNGMSAPVRPSDSVKLYSSMVFGHKTPRGMQEQSLSPALARSSRTGVFRAQAAPVEQLREGDSDLDSDYQMQMKMQMQPELDDGRHIYPNGMPVPKQLSGAGSRDSGRTPTSISMAMQQHAMEQARVPASIAGHGTGLQQRVSGERYQNGHQNGEQQQQQLSPRAMFNLEMRGEQLPRSFETGEGSHPVVFDYYRDAERTALSA